MFANCFPLMYNSVSVGLSGSMGAQLLQAPGWRARGRTLNTPVFLLGCCMLVVQLAGPQKYSPQNKMLKCWQKVPPVSEFKNLGLFEQSK